MQRRQLLKLVAGAGLGAVCAPMVNQRRYRVFAGSKQEYSARAVELVGRSVVIDMLSPFKLGSTTWFTNPDSFKQVDFQRFKDSGINAFHIAVGTGGVEAYLNTLRFIASWDSFLANHDLWLMRVDSASDLDRLKNSGKVGVILGVQNSEHFRSPADVDYFHSLGQRVSQLTYNTRNLIGNGSTERRSTLLNFRRRPSSSRIRTAARSFQATRAARPTRRSKRWPPRAG